MHYPYLIAQDAAAGFERLDAEHRSRPAFAAEAREAVREFLAALSPALAASEAQSLLLLVSELVTNALRHAGAVSALWLRADAERVTIGVEDASPEFPRERAPDLSGSAGGFGWPMVRRMTESLTVRHLPGGGKAVVATLTR